MSFVDAYEPFFQEIRQSLEPKYLKYWVEMHLSDGTYYVYDNENKNNANLVLAGKILRFIDPLCKASYSRPLFKTKLKTVEESWEGDDGRHE